MFAQIQVHVKHAQKAHIKIRNRCANCVVLGVTSVQRLLLVQLAVRDTGKTLLVISAKQ